MSKSICSDKTVWGIREQAVIEGSVPLPAGVNEPVSVLRICGNAEVKDISFAENITTVSGNARFTITVSSSGGIDSFDTECAFSHTSQIPGISGDMTLAATAEPVWMNCRPDGAFLSLSAGIMIDVSGCGPDSVAALEPDEDDDIEYDIKSEKTVKSALRAVKCYASGELRIPQTMPEAEKLLSIDGYAIVRSVRNESGRTAIEGELMLQAAYLCADNNAPLQFFSGSVDFGEVLSDPLIDEESLVYVTAAPEKISASCENDVITVSAVIALNALICREEEESFVADMYSLSRDTAVKRSRLSSAAITAFEPVEKVLRSTIQIPDTSPEAARVLSASAGVEIASAIPSGARLTVDGIMHISLCYTSNEAGLRSITVKEPLSEELPFACSDENAHVFVKAYAEQVSVSGSGRELAVKLCIEFTAFAVTERDICPVISAEFGEAEENDGGIAVYYADGSETMFDIARRNKVRKKCVSCLDEERDIPRRGERLLIIK